MKSTFAISAVILSGLLACSTNSLAMHHDIKLNQNTLTKNQQLNDFELVLSQIQNNSVGNYLSISTDDYTKKEVIQLLEALQHNTSVNYLSFADRDANSISYGEGRHDAAVLNALVDLLSVTQKINSLSLNGHPPIYAGSTNGGTFDADSLKKINAALENNTAITYLEFDGWEISRSIGLEIANLVKKKNSLNSLDMYFINCGWSCIAAADIISEAVIGSSIDSVRFNLEDEGGSVNTAIAQNLAKAALAKPKMNSIDIDGFAVDVETAKNFSTFLENSTSIKSLDLENNKMEDKAFSALMPGLVKNTSLIELDISNQTLTETSNANLLFSVIGKNSHLASFSAAHLFTSALSHNIWQTLTHNVAQSQSLQGLELDEMHMNDADLALLGNALVGHKSLKWMSLSQNDFSAAGIDAFATILEANTSLTGLWISTTTGEDIDAPTQRIDEITRRNVSIP